MEAIPNPALVALDETVSRGTILVKESAALKSAGCGQLEPVCTGS